MPLQVSSDFSHVWIIWLVSLGRRRIPCRRRCFHARHGFNQTALPRCGLLLYRKVIEHWALERSRTLEFYSTDGKELLHRHPLNKNRGQATVVKVYKDSILKSGLLTAVRGRAIAVPKSSSNCGVLECGRAHWLIGHATLTEAIYHAAREHPDNLMVQEHWRKVCLTLLSYHHAHLRTSCCGLMMSTTMSIKVSA